jgi:transposase-like protein
MARIARKADGRRIFTPEFKREQIDRVLSGELTMSELSRKLGIAGSLLHRWRRRMPQPADFAHANTVRAAPARRLEAAQYIRELQLLVGKQAMELELLRSELDTLKKGRMSRGGSRR